MAFYCDPQKCKYCTKENCFLIKGDCFLTSKQSASVDDRPLFPSEGWKLCLAQKRMRRAFRAGKLAVTHITKGDTHVRKNK